VLLLDMQMPGCDGLTVAARLPAAERPAVIFVTAHAEFAVGAFAVQAVDYLLKPFDRARLDAALARIDAVHAALRASRLEQRIAERRPVSSPTARLAVPTNGRLVLVRTDEIVWVEAASNYVMLHLVDRRRLMLRTSMALIEQRLGTTQFIRVNRSAVARIAQIRELRPVGYGDYAVLLRSGESLPLSRPLRGQIQRFLT
jgi:two-component system LytT family response regulator